MQQDTPRAPRTHPLAYFALVCSCLICCPVTSLTGALMGWLALRSIDASQGVFIGRKLAIWAIIIGVLMLPLQILGLQSVQSLNERMIEGGIQRAVSSVFAIDAEDRAEQLRLSFIATGSRRPTVAEADEFVERATARFGAYRSVTVAQSEPGDSDFFQPSYQLSLVFTFEGGRATGGAETVLVATAGNFEDSLHLRLLELELGDGVLLKLPPDIDDGEAAATPEVTGGDE